MTGTKIGSLNRRKTMIARLGSEQAYLEWCRALGSKGGKKDRDTPRGFAAMPREKVAAAGRLGGAKSRRKPVDKKKP